MSYKKLGGMVKFISNKNTDGNATVLFGININKFFMPSVANIIGVDLKKYKVVEKYQFACNRMHVGRDERLPISMSTFDYDFIVSPAYDVFEVTSADVLPEYLMLWFRRKEFDRQCWFYTDADVRGGLHLDALKSIEIKVPTIEEQRQIVAQYQSIANKIKVNEQICEKLEATAQALYKHWFVDFEFPNEEGKSYKSSDGKMVWNEELGKEIPEGWEYDYISSISKEIITGKTPPTDDEENFGTYMPFVTIPDMHNNVFITRSERYLSEKGVGYQKNKTLPINSICVSCIGTAGLVSITSAECQTNQQINSIVCQDDISVYYTYITLKALEKQIIEWGSRGSVGINMNKTEFSQIKILIPKQIIMRRFDKIVVTIFEILKLKTTEAQKLGSLQSLLLSRLAVGEEVGV